MADVKKLRCLAPSVMNYLIFAGLLRSINQFNDLFRKCSGLNITANTIAVDGLNISKMNIFFLIKYISVIAKVE